MEKKIVLLLLLSSFTTLMSAPRYRMVLGELVDVARVQQEQEVTFDQSEDDFETDDWDIEKMGDDFLIAGTPYPPIVLKGIQVGAFLLYCYLQVEKGVRYSFNKTLRVLRVRNS